MTIKLRLEERGGAHVFVGVFVGPDADHLARSGLLTMRGEEWAVLLFEGYVRDVVNVDVADGEVKSHYELLLVPFDEDATKPGGEM